MKETDNNNYGLKQKKLMEKNSFVITCDFEPHSYKQQKKNTELFMINNLK